MKIGISLPDDLFREVERTAKRLGVSRSELLARAAVEFLAEHRAQEVTRSYDLAFARTDAKASDDDERFHREAARRLLLDVEW